MRESGDRVWTSPFSSKDAFQIWSLGRDVKVKTVERERRGRGSEKKDRDKWNRGLADWRGRGGKTKPPLVPSVEKKNVRDFLGTKMADCNDERAMELITNRHYCSGDGFLSSSWWYEDIHIYLKGRILALLHEIAFLWLIRLTGPSLCVLRDSIQSE